MILTELPLSINTDISVPCILTIWVLLCLFLAEPRAKQNSSSEEESCAVVMDTLSWWLTGYTEGLWF